MKSTTKKIFISLLTVLMLFSFALINAYAAQGTNGDELQVVEAQELEIQLGTEWSGVEFILRTDSGVYPGIIPVDETGVLSLEIGGSKTYTLSCLQSSVHIPDVTLLQAPVTSETEIETNVAPTEAVNTSTVPVTHIVMFGVGIIVAVGILIAIYISGKNKQTVQDDEEDDDF